MSDDFPNPCQQCGGDPLPPHPCPFAEEIRGDDTTMCNCCDECAHGCAMDI